MAATPKKGVFLFKGLRTGKIYSVANYRSDVANALTNWDAGAGAASTSPTEWNAPENVSLFDVSLITGCADTTQMRIVAGSKPTDVILDYTVHVSTSPLRPRLNLNFRAGTPIRCIQLA
jgi:hypothetical protein